jgi:hypothetical protein
MAELVSGFRTTLTASFADAGHPSPDGAARLVTAVFDGFVLHKGLDPELSGARIAPMLRTLTSRTLPDVEPPDPNGAPA